MVQSCSSPSGSADWLGFARFKMQPPEQPSSSISSSVSGELVLKPNATVEEKLALLAVLVPKAENAKNRVADLHAKTLATIDLGNQLAGKILEVNGYAHLFFQGMNPQLVVRARFKPFRFQFNENSGSLLPQHLLLVDPSSLKLSPI